MQKLWLSIAVGLGLLLAFVDTRPNWDDTGIIAGAIAIGCAALGALAPARPWLWALAVGIWIPLVEMGSDGNFGPLLALVIALAAAYAGMAFRRVVMVG